MLNFANFGWGTNIQRGILHVLLNSLSIPATNLEADKCVLQNEIEIVGGWLADNKLFLYLGKTESIYILDSD